LLLLAEQIFDAQLHQQPRMSGASAHWPCHCYTCTLC
jgi:hypothetical protein